MTVPEKKYELIRETEQRVVDIEDQYNMGFITDEERYKLVVASGKKTTNDVTDALTASLDRYNPIFMMADSGARGSMKQIRQLTGMRGLMANTAGKTIEIPIKANFREGMSVLDYFTSSRGARKGLADTALRTADSGYLTRRMVDVCQDVIIREDDCGVHKGILVSEISENGQVIEKFSERIRGRFPVHDITDPKTGEVLISKDHMMTEDDAALLENFDIHSAEIRTVLTCKAHSGICAKVLRHEPGHLQAGGPRRGRWHHRSPVHRRARYPADHAYLPYRRRGRRRHHPGSSPRGGTVRGPQAQEDGHPGRRSAARSASRRPPRAVC